MSSRSVVLNLQVAVVFGVVTIGVWALANLPRSEPPWPEQIAGMSFSPFRDDQNPMESRMPTAEQIDADLALVAGKVRSVRTYSVKGTLAEVPRLAEKHGLNVTLGAWLSNDADANEIEVSWLIEVARANPNVDRVIIGNEAVLRAEVTMEEMLGHLDRVRRAIKQPVSTAEPWHVWLKYPELADHVDFISAHLLPYWEGVALDDAVNYCVDKHDILETAFPGKPILLAEVGWPSNGRTRRSSVASQANEATFLRRFLATARAEKYDYYIMEAFDQPWKAESEGSVGAYWGVYDLNRVPKFEFTEPIVRVPNWRILAAATIAIAIFALSMLLIDGSSLGRRGRGFLAAMAHGVSAGVVWVGYDYSNQYLTPFTIAVGVALALGFLGINLVMLTEAHEMAEASWVSRRRRLFRAAADPEGAAPSCLPKVSVHVPAYNEPPAMMIETLDALARLDYPDFEVVVIDNNTKDPATWQPVEAHCERLGPRFRFFHVDPLKGFKAGALNYALAHTAEDAEIIAVIDSDYAVSPSWLKDLVPHFAEPRIGIVQAPQDYRDADESAFKKMCYSEYKGFFHIGMVTRNDRNAIIQHGTMTMIRASVLREVGGWAEWCITEDAELGLRIFEHGYEAAYIEDSYGKGLMPDTFVDYKKQRFRWAYGAVRILRAHWREMLGLRMTRLTAGQRYHFLAGWLPWLADGLNLFYTMGALAWSAAIVIDPKHVDPPLAVFTVPPLALFVFKVIKLGYLYRSRVRATNTQTASAALAGLALSHTIAKAVILGFFTRGKPFFRTPKCENRPALFQAFANAAEETALTAALWAGAVGVAVVQGRDLPGSLLWAATLAVQSLPYLAALVVSLINAIPSRRMSPSHQASLLQASSGA